MKRILKYNEKLFWKIEVDGTKYTITSGEEDKEGKVVSRTLLSEESAINMANKLVQAKIKSGYVEIKTDNKNEKAGWFEKLENKIFEAYEKNILAYKSGSYKYIQLKLNGERFALGLRIDEKDNYWEYLTDDIWNFTELSIERIYLQKQKNKVDDDYEKVLERNEWPYNSDDCFHFQAYLVSVALAKVYLKLKNDEGLKKHLSAITTVIIDAHDIEIAPFSHSYPAKKLRTKVVKKFMEDLDNQKLILDLWGDQLTDVSIDFLKSLNKDTSKLKKVSIDEFREHYKKALKLSESGSYKQALKLLEPSVEAILNNGENKDARLIEKACGVLAACYKAKKEYEQAIFWYKKGVEYLPWGYCALNLMATYRNSVKNFEELIVFGEKHLEHARKNDKSYTFFSYNYLAYAYLQTKNKEKATEFYQRILKLFNEDKEKIEKILKELNEIKNSNKLAKDILDLFTYNKH